MELSRFIGRLNVLFLLLVLVVGWLIWSPPKGPGSTGEEDGAMTAPEAALFQARAENELKDGREVILTESDLNRFINGALAGQQSFVIDPWVQVSGLHIELGQDEFRLTLQRDLIGLSHEVALDYKVESELLAGTVRRRTFEVTGGKLGRLLLPPAIIARLSSWTATLGSDSKELWSTTLAAAGVIEFREGKMVLKPQPGQVF